MSSLKETFKTDIGKFTPVNVPAGVNNASSISDAVKQSIKNIAYKLFIKSNAINETDYSRFKSFAPMTCKTIEDESPYISPTVLGEAIDTVGDILIHFSYNNDHSHYFSDHKEKVFFKELASLKSIDSLSSLNKKILIAMIQDGVGDKGVTTTESGDEEATILEKLKSAAVAAGKISNDLGNLVKIESIESIDSNENKENIASFLQKYQEDKTKTNSEFPLKFGLSHATGEAITWSTYFSIVKNQDDPTTKSFLMLMYLKNPNGKFFVGEKETETPIVTAALSMSKLSEPSEFNLDNASQPDSVDVLKVDNYYTFESADAMSKGTPWPSSTSDINTLFYSTHQLDSTGVIAFLVDPFLGFSFSNQLENVAVEEAAARGSSLEDLLKENNGQTSSSYKPEQLAWFKKYLTTINNSNVASASSKNGHMLRLQRTMNILILSRIISFFNYTKWNDRRYKSTGEDGNPLPTNLNKGDFVEYSPVLTLSYFKSNYPRIYEAILEGSDIQSGSGDNQRALASTLKAMLGTNLTGFEFAKKYYTNINSGFVSGNKYLKKAYQMCEALVYNRSSGYLSKLEALGFKSEEINMIKKYIEKQYAANESFLYNGSIITESDLRKIINKRIILKEVYSFSSKTKLIADLKKLASEVESESELVEKDKKIEDWWVDVDNTSKTDVVNAYNEHLKDNNVSNQDLSPAATAADFKTSFKNGFTKAQSNASQAEADRQKRAQDIVNGESDPNWATFFDINLEKANKSQKVLDYIKWVQSNAEKHPQQASLLLDIDTSNVDLSGNGEIGLNQGQLDKLETTFEGGKSGSTPIPAIGKEYLSSGEGQSSLNLSITVPEEEETDVGSNTVGDATGTEDSGGETKRKNPTFIVNADEKAAELEYGKVGTFLRTAITIVGMPRERMDESRLRRAIRSVLTENDATFQSIVDTVDDADRDVEAGKSKLDTEILRKYAIEIGKELASSANHKASAADFTKEIFEKMREAAGPDKTMSDVSSDIRGFDKKISNTDDLVSLIELSDGGFFSNIKDADGKITIRAVMEAGVKEAIEARDTNLEEAINALVQPGVMGGSVWGVFSTFNEPNKPLYIVCINAENADESLLGYTFTGGTEVNVGTNRSDFFGNYASLQNTGETLAQNLAERVILSAIGDQDPEFKKVAEVTSGNSSGMKATWSTANIKEEMSYKEMSNLIADRKYKDRRLVAAIEKMSEFADILGRRESGSEFQDALMLDTNILGMLSSTPSDIIGRTKKSNIQAYKESIKLMNTLFSKPGTPLDPGEKVVFSLKGNKVIPASPQYTKVTNFMTSNFKGDEGFGKALGRVTKGSSAEKQRGMSDDTSFARKKAKSREAVEGTDASYKPYGGGDVPVGYELKTMENGTKILVKPAVQGQAASSGFVDYFRRKRVSVKFPLDPDYFREAAIQNRAVEKASNGYVLNKKFARDYSKDAKALPLLTQDQYFVVLLMDKFGKDAKGLKEVDGSEIIEASKEIRKSDFGGKYRSYVAAYESWIRSVFTDDISQSGKNQTQKDAVVSAIRREVPAMKRGNYTESDVFAMTKDGVDFQFSPGLKGRKLKRQSKVKAEDFDTKRRDKKAITFTYIHAPAPKISDPYKSYIKPMLNLCSQGYAAATIADDPDPNIFESLVNRHEVLYEIYKRNKVKDVLKEKVKKNYKKKIRNSVIKRLLEDYKSGRVVFSGGPGDFFKTPEKASKAQKGSEQTKKRAVPVGSENDSKRKGPPDNDVKNGAPDATPKGVVAVEQLAASVLPVEGSYTVTSLPHPNRIIDTSDDTPRHAGIDFQAACGSNALSILGEGVVKTVVNDKGSATSGYGNQVVIEYPKYTVRYAHLEEVETSITEGSTVAKGQKIGLTGKSGGAKGCHLHIEFFGKGGKENWETSLNWLTKNKDTLNIQFSDTDKEPGNISGVATAGEASLEREYRELVAWIDNGRDPDNLPISGDLHRKERHKREKKEAAAAASAGSNAGSQGTQQGGAVQIGATHLTIKGILFNDENHENYRSVIYLKLSNKLYNSQVKNLGQNEKRRAFNNGEKIADLTPGNTSSVNTLYFPMIKGTVFDDILQKNEFVSHGNGISTYIYEDSDGINIPGIHFASNFVSSGEAYYEVHDSVNYIKIKLF